MGITLSNALFKALHMNSFMKKTKTQEGTTEQLKQDKNRGLLVTLLIFITR